MKLFKKFKNEFSLAFNSLYNWIGILLASISTFNIIIKGFNLGISYSLKLILEGYRFVFYNIIDFSLSWLNFQFPYWVKDLIVIYIIISLAIIRTVNPSLKWLIEFLKKHKLTKSRTREVFFFQPPLANNKYLFYIFTLFFFPIVLYRIFSTPYFWSNDALAFQNSKGEYMTVYELYPRNKKIFDFGNSGYDARILLLLQFLSILITVFILSVINGGLKTYS